MNILILTGRFGMGHNSAAAAVKEHLLIENPLNKVTIIDFFDYMYPKLNRTIYAGFDFLVGKCHHLYNMLNDAAAKHTGIPLEKTIIKKIDTLLSDTQADMIISVLPICSQYISAYKKMFGNRIVLSTCITDIDVHKEWLASENDLYFVGAESTRDYLISCGVDENKVVISGIPVRAVFKGRQKVHNTKKEILIMGGGLGLIPHIDRFLAELERNEDINITIITGHNKKLYNKLSHKHGSLNIIRYTNEVAAYLSKADLIITKAGGITLFESIHSQTPMFVINPFLSQEIGNAKYIVENNIGKVIWDHKADIAAAIIELISDNESLCNMRRNMQMIQEQLNTVSFICPASGKDTLVC